MRRILGQVGNVVNGDQTFHGSTLSDEHARCSDGFPGSTRPVVWKDGSRDIPSFVFERTVRRVCATPHTSSPQRDIR
jgi:hypothetical protein